jgi:N-acetylmuramoyl-L-alanine amidase
MRQIDTLIIHCTDTPTGRETTVEDIDSWHVDRGFKRLDIHRAGFNPTLLAIGYHYVIYLDGSVHTGRQVEEIGAHCSGLNAHSIGISMVGRGVYTMAQWSALAELIATLQRTYPAVKIIGHCDTPSGSNQGKKCPEFDVQQYISAMTPDPAHIA